MGERARDNDLEVNPVREKKLSNIRTVNADEKVSVVSPVSSISSNPMPNCCACPVLLPGGCVSDECTNIASLSALLTHLGDLCCRHT